MSAAWLHRLREHPSALLLFVQLAGVLLYPLLDELAHSRAIFNVFGLLVLGLALRMVRRSPAATWIAVVLASLVAGLLILQSLAPWPAVAMLISALESAFYFYAAGSLIAYMMEDQRATTDELFAAGATFTLLAWAYAHAFALCQAWVAGSFGPKLEPCTWMELLFLSFTVLSGVGLGDIVPLQPMARALVMLAEFTGVMYIAVVVSRLIAMTLPGRH